MSIFAETIEKTAQAELDEHITEQNREAERKRELEQLGTLAVANDILLSSGQGNPLQEVFEPADSELCRDFLQQMKGLTFRDSVELRNEEVASVGVRWNVMPWKESKKDNDVRRDRSVGIRGYHMGTIVEKGWPYAYPDISPHSHKVKGVYLCEDRQIRVATTKPETVTLLQGYTVGVNLNKVGSLPRDGNDELAPIQVGYFEKVYVNQFSYNWKLVNQSVEERLQMISKQVGQKIGKETIEAQTELGTESA